MKSSNNTKDPKIGDIYLVYFDGSGNEQKGFRPGLVFQNNVGNEHSPNLIVLPLTSALKKINQPTHVFIPKEVGLRKDSSEMYVKIQTWRVYHYITRRIYGTSRRW